MAPLPILVVVSGPMGSGKTTLAHRLAGSVGCPANPLRLAHADPGPLDAADHARFRRYPERAKLSPADAAGYREAPYAGVKVYLATEAVQRDAALGGLKFRHRAWDLGSADRRHSGHGDRGHGKAGDG